MQSSLMSSTICPQLKYSIFANKKQKKADVFIAYQENWR